MRNIAPYTCIPVPCITPLSTYLSCQLSLCNNPKCPLPVFLCCTCILRILSYPCIHPVVLSVYFASCFFLLSVNNHTYIYMYTYRPRNHTQNSLQKFPQSFAIIPVFFPDNFFLNFFSVVSD